MLGPLGRSSGEGYRMCKGPGGGKSPPLRRTKENMRQRCSEDTGEGGSDQKLRKSCQPRGEWRTDHGGDRVAAVSGIWKESAQLRRQGAPASQREAQRRQPEGPRGGEEMLWMALGDHAGRINCAGWCRPGTGTQTPKRQACDLRASPSSR